MKIMNILVVVCLTILTACTNKLPGDNDEGNDTENEPVHLSFLLYDSSPTKALGAIATENMSDGTAFMVYAYKKDDDVTTKAPLGSASYTVSGGSATGELSLYRGEYDLYMVSVNTNNAPAATSGVLTVANNSDFMYNMIKGQLVKPDQGGGKAMSIPMTGPFIRTGTMLDLAVMVNPNSPVKVTNLSVNSIKISNLCDSRTYTLGNDALSEATAYGSNINVSGFTYDQPENKYKKSVVVLPTNGSEELGFDINLDITYQEGTSDISGTYTYTVNLPKALLRGMRYSLTFNLTFFGKLTFGDISLTLKEYTDSKQDINDVGE